MDDIIAQFERKPIFKKVYTPVNKLYRKPSYNEVIGYIETEPNDIKYPNRQAKFLRDSFELSFLDKFNNEMLEDKQKELLKYQITQESLRRLAAENGTSLSMEQARAASSINPPWLRYFTPEPGSSAFQTPLPAQMPGGQPPPPPPGAEGVRQVVGQAKAKAKASPIKVEHYNIADDEESPPYSLLKGIQGIMGGIDVLGNKITAGFDNLLEQAGSGSASSSAPAMPSSWGPFTAESPPSPENIRMFQGVLDFLKSTGKVEVVQQEIQDNVDRQHAIVSQGKKRGPKSQQSTPESA